MYSIEDLSAIEEIRQLKAQYCRALDTFDREGMTRLFDRDMVFDNSREAPSQEGQILPPPATPYDVGEGNGVTFGLENFTKRLHTMEPRVQSHHVHESEIQLTSPTEAWAIIPLDVVRFFHGKTVTGSGHYHETYKKIEDRWLIKSVIISWLWVRVVKSEAVE